MQDVRDGLSEFPHVIVNQARLRDFLLEYARNSPSRLRVDYGHEAVAVQAPKSDDEPVVVTIRRGDGTEVTRRSQVRRRLRRCTQHRARVHRPQAAGRRVDDKAWGVMDLLAVTDFPDIRFKCYDPVAATVATSCSSPARAVTCSVCTWTWVRSPPDAWLTRGRGPRSGPAVS